MDVAAPHYLLFSQASHTRGVGHWQFVLRSADGSEQIQAADVEPDSHGQRLELLTVVRALESLDKPSHVTLMGAASTSSMECSTGCPSGKPTAGGGSVSARWSR